jgi:hydroxymethylpyrimidine pyrophosphatase-like HAD family hydrolase
MAPPNAGDLATSNQTRNPYAPTSQVRLLALDMDGTLLNSKSEVLPSSVEAIREVISKGVTVMLATGKARPAAVAALKKVNLVGDGLVVGSGTPGIFLQGLAVHGIGGELIAGGVLDSSCGFHGESCITTKMTPEVEELHHRYYEPLATVVPTIDDVLEQGPLRKLIFLASPHEITNAIGPEWTKKLKATNAQTMQAVPSMLEIVPKGINKWVGMQALLDHMNLKAHEVMAIGDGGNDLELVANVGIGVAMGNAVPSVKTAATLIVSSNNENGIAEAIERCILW